MAIDASANRVYLDFSHFESMRAQARGHSEQAVKEVAAQFEALFLQFALKSMRDATLSSNLLDNDGSRFYQGLLDQQLTLTLSGRGLGLASVIERQLARHAPSPAPSQTVPDARDQDDSAAVVPQAAPPAPAEGWRIETRAVAPSTDRLAAAAPSAVATPAQVPGSQPSAEQVAASPQSFLARLWPLAERAGAELGVQPRALLAQAALETGWGRHIIKRADGSSSFNLFGIKADRRWQGDRISSGTREYVDGQVVNTGAAFRAYDSFADSFNDYVAFLRENPRYREALTRTGDPVEFVGALQRAGFATDPRYAGKITDIMNGATMRGMLALRDDLSRATG